MNENGSPLRGFPVFNYLYYNKYGEALHLGAYYKTKKILPIQYWQKTK
jgi:hypothetical protein